MKIDVSSSDALPSLVATLAAADCFVWPVDATSCRVLVPSRLEQDEAMLDLRFFVSAWAATQPGVDATVTP